MELGLLRDFLLPAYVVRGKVIFILGNVCLFTIGGGMPFKVWMGGTPFYVWVGGTHPRYGWGGTPSQVWGGTPSQVWMGVPPTMTGWGTPHHDWIGYPPIRQSSIVSTCYMVGGMPLAFTQEDFLVWEFFHLR